MVHGPWVAANPRASLAPPTARGTWCLGTCPPPGQHSQSCGLGPRDGDLHEHLHGDLHGDLYGDLYGDLHGDLHPLKIIDSLT